MRTRFVAAALAGMLVAVAACSGAGSTGSSAPTGGSATASTAPAGSSVPASTAPTGSSASAGGAATSADRDKFVGTWTGKYGCDATNTIDDKMIVKAGSGDLDLSITIHSNASNPATVTGKLTSPTEVNVPEQSMGDVSSTARLKLTGDALDFHATAMGMTCGGSAYTHAKTATPTQSAAVSATPTSSQTALPSFVGEWERHRKEGSRPVTEHFALNPDGTYSIEARFDDTNAVVASSHGTYKSTRTTLTLTDQNAKTTISHYALDSSGRLVIDSKPELAWTRVH